MVTQKPILLIKNILGKKILRGSENVMRAFFLTIETRAAERSSETPPLTYARLPLKCSCGPFEV